MISFDNWLETRQGKFFQEKIGKEEMHLSRDELFKIYVIFKNNQFDGTRGIAIKECWHLQNKDGSTGIPGL
tara:strand:- start:352 stop:564 length:213 start_codon:yes stop_codon:yes gene_type:complete